MVTVEEINKTALEKQLRCENSPEMEVASTSDATSTSTSHIFGKWWTGKSTKLHLALKAELAIFIFILDLYCTATKGVVGGETTIRTRHLII